MTTDGFMVSLKSCYSFAKTPGQIGIIAGWIQTIPECRLDRLWTEVTENISTEYGQSADLARVRKLYYGIMADHDYADQIEVMRRRRIIESAMLPEDRLECQEKLKEIANKFNVNKYNKE